MPGEMSCSVLAQRHVYNEALAVSTMMDTAMKMFQRIAIGPDASIAVANPPLKNRGVQGPIPCATIPPDERPVNPQGIARQVVRYPIMLWERSSGDTPLRQHTGGLGPEGACPPGIYRVIPAAGRLDKRHIQCYNRR